MFKTKFKFQNDNSIFSRGEHLAVLNTYDSFFVCKTMQNIFAPAQKVIIKICWHFQKFQICKKYVLFFKACETVTSHPNSKYKSQGEKRIKIKWLTQDSDNPTSFHYDYEQRIGESRRLFVKIQLLETEEIQRQVRLISPCPRLVSFEMHNVYDQ